MHFAEVQKFLDIKIILPKYEERKQTHHMDGITAEWEIRKKRKKKMGSLFQNDQTSSIPKCLEAQDRDLCIPP